MSFSLKSLFFAHARGVTFTDANGISWGFNASTNSITAAYSGAGSAGAANPTAKVGLTAVNGVLATFMRSDAAPPLDLTISPTWTGNHVFNAAAGVPMTVKLNGTIVFICNGLTAPTTRGYGPTAGALVDMTPDTGTFTMTLTGCTTSPTGTAVWSRVGNLVTLFIPAVTGTSNSTSCTMTGLPAVIQPARAQNICIGSFEDNSANTSKVASVTLVNGSGTLTFLLGGSTTGFTSSGTKGPQSNTITYLLN